MRLTLTFVFACLLVVACRPSTTGTHDGERDGVVGRGWLDDRDSTLTPEGALERSWTPFVGPLSRGFTSSATWLRLRIDPAVAGPGSVASDHRLVLRVMPEHLDEVAVYRVGRLSEPPVVIGDQHPVSGPAQSLQAHAVVFDDATTPFELLLRLRTQSNQSIDVQAVRWDAAVELRAASLARAVMVLVFSLMVMAFALLSWLEHRDAAVGLFIAMQGGALLLSAMLLGVPRVYGPTWLLPALDRLTSVAIPLSAGAWVTFHARLLPDLGAGRTETKLLRAWTLLPVVALLLVGFGQVRHGLLLSQVANACLMAMLVVTAWRIRSGPDAGGRTRGGWRRAYIVGVYVAMAALTLPQNLRALGLVPAQRWSFNGFLFYSVGGALLMGGLLVFRGREARRHRREAQLALEEARREAVAQRARATEQSELLTMLTHELKTPLSVVSLALGDSEKKAAMRERALRAVDNMSGVIDRCSQTALYDDGADSEGAPAELSLVPVEAVLADAIDAQLLAPRVECHVADDLPACRADRRMLLVIVGNLLENALKYCPRDGRVRAFLEAAAFEGRPGVALRVSNRLGTAGRPDAAHVFEKYHRGARARHVSGSGLGLYLSHRLAARLGGRLTLRDADAGDDPVTFELWLPN